MLVFRSPRVRRSGKQFLRTKSTYNPHILLTPNNSTQITDGCGVGHIRQLLCFRDIQAMTADTVIAYITYDDRPNNITSVKPARSEATWRLVNFKMSMNLEIRSLVYWWMIPVVNSASSPHQCGVLLDCCAVADPLHAPLYPPSSGVKQCIWKHNVLSAVNSGHLSLS